MGCLTIWLVQSLGGYTKDTGYVVSAEGAFRRFRQVLLRCGIIHPSLFLQVINSFFLGDPKSQQSHRKWSHNRANGDHGDLGFGDRLLPIDQITKKSDCGHLDQSDRKTPTIRGLDSSQQIFATGRLR